MRLNDYLRTFSVEDLRELAARRGVRLSQSALNGRQTLVQTLTAVLARHDTVSYAVSSLNAAELGVLQYVLQHQGRVGLSGIAAAAGVDAGTARGVLESLRLWGLVFPEGDWEQLAVSPAAQYAVSHTAARRPTLAQMLQFEPPPLEEASGIECRPRPGSFGRDLAELLGRVARSRMKLTQAGRINRRDLKTLEPALSISSPGYSTFVYMIAAALGLLEASEDGFLTTSDRADPWLAQSEESRTRSAVETWRDLQGYPESSHGDPAEYPYEYMPPHLPLQRRRVLEMVGGLDWGAAYSSVSLAKRMLWLAPLSFQQWQTSQDAGQVVRRMLRSVFWLGLAGLDDPERPAHAGVTPLGARVLGGDPGAPPLVPEEVHFFLQPNAEAFAPPNLSPRTLFHLRRITGESKGGAAGVYPVTSESIRRALDSGLTAAEIAAFLERFSRTGLPDNVRALVETAGRQYGRIRLIPTGYVVLTDTPELMEELRSGKPLAPLLGRPVTERVAAVEMESVPELLRRLRARGYAPLNEGETGKTPALPDDPDAMPAPPPRDEAREFRAPAELDWTAVAEDEEVPPQEPGPKVSGREPIRRLLEKAADAEDVVEIEYSRPGSEEPIVRTIWPLEVFGGAVTAFCCLRWDERRFLIDRINWARLTGERFDSEYV